MLHLNVVELMASENIVYNIIIYLNRTDNTGIQVGQLKIFRSIKYIKVHWGSILNLSFKIVSVCYLIILIIVYCSEGFSFFMIFFVIKCLSTFFSIVKIYFTVKEKGSNWTHWTSDMHCIFSKLNLKCSEFWFEQL